jgi:hypothetical protein
VVLYGTGKYRYELVGGDVRNPEGWMFFSACGLDIDSQDRVYIKQDWTSAIGL